MLCLNSKEIESAVTYKELVDAVEKAFLLYEKGDFLMPQRMHVDSGDNTLLLMPCFSGNRFGTKLVSFFPENARKGKPAIYGTVILNDGETGEALCMLNGAKLTAMRTGAVGGVGVRHLSHESASTVGIVGSGVQAFHQALFACAERPIKKLYMLDNFNPNLDLVINKLELELPSIDIIKETSAERLVDNSEIIITATNSKLPVLPDNEELYFNKTIIAIGSYKKDMQEIPDAAFAKAKQYFIDTLHARNETGDIIGPLQENIINDNQLLTIGKLLNNSVKKENSELQIFKSVGMALFDLIVSDLIYQKAIDKGLGTEIDL